MDDDIFTGLSDETPIKTYGAPASQIAPIPKTPHISDNCKKAAESRVPLTTKNAVKFLLEGKLKSLVCRYCLNVAPSLSELDQILHVSGAGTTYEVTIRAMVASFHPVQVAEDINFPDKICNKCLNLTISSYLFTQQCERSERAIRNCLDDIYEKVEKLDPIDRPKKRGRQKQNPNYNVIHAEHEKVIDYADPIVNIVNLGAESFTNEPEMTQLECKKCWQVLPNMESLLNHEKIHPDTMWYHCRLCGKSFPKHNQFKKHYHKVHVLGKEPKMTEAIKKFKCNPCGHITEDYKQHLQHMEKHKFKAIMKHLVERKMDKLCMVCLDKTDSLMDLDRMVCIHGGYPELMGDRSLQTVLASTLPDMTNLQNYIGSKICEKCLNHAITSYVFINQFSFSRERLDVCVSHMLKCVSDIQPDANIFVHISDDTIMPITEDYDEMLLLDDNDFLDETQLKVEYLEDEFRVQSESEEDTRSDVNALQEQTVHKPNKQARKHKSLKEIIPLKPDNFIEEERENSLSADSIDNLLENPAKNVTKTYVNKKLVNGVHTNKYTDVCSEFLTFNKRPRRRCRFTCPLCSKHFISDYFLKRHILKHVLRTVECDICNGVFESKFNLYEHKKMTHLQKQIDYLSCKVCGRTFLAEEKLKSHERHHRNKFCGLCQKAYANQRCYDSHVQRHAMKLYFVKRRRVQICSFCEKECTNGNQLSLHVNKIHFQMKPYCCDMCDRQFYTQSNLHKHKKIHSIPSKEMCAFCKKTLKSRKRLVTHIRKHIGATPFTCLVCGQCFHSQHKTREHMKLYHGGRFCCGICKTTFITKYGLKAHVNKDHSFI